MLEIFDSMKKTVKFWWISLIVGILAIALGVWCLLSPDKSLVGMAYVFVIVFLIGGILDIIFAVINRKYVHGWGWTLAAGIMETLLGILLLTLPTYLVTSVLVYFVGFWILFRSIWGIGESFQLQTLGVKGWGWLLVLSILCVILSFLYLLSPVFGGIFVVVLVGMTVILYGILRIVIAFKLRKFGKKMKDLED
jgi:uncharacterized membrane protein HdeD (DUF308 family)